MDHFKEKCATIELTVFEILSIKNALTVYSESERFHDAHPVQELVDHFNKLRKDMIGPPPTERTSPGDRQRVLDLHRRRKIEKCATIELRDLEILSIINALTVYSESKGFHDTHPVQELVDHFNKLRKDMIGPPPATV